MQSYETLDGLVSKLNQRDDIKGKLSGERRLVQFQVDGEDFFLLINEDGSAELKKGTEQSPTVTLTASDQVLGEVLSGKLNGVQAFLTGKLKLNGNIMEAQKLVSVLEKAR